MVRQGSLLENSVKRIFDSAGFKTEQNAWKEGYEIDVLAKYKGYVIAVECKERQSSGLIVRNLIHEWSGKSKELKIDKVLIVVYGKTVTPEDKTLAKERSMSLWGNKDVDYFLDLAMKNDENLSTMILDNMEIKTKEVERLRLERERNWKPDIETLKEIYDNHSPPLCEIVVLHGDSEWRGGYYILNEDDSIKDLSRALSKRIKLKPEELDKRIKEINTGMEEPLRILIYPFELDEEILKVADKNGIR